VKTWEAPISIFERKHCHFFKFGIKMKHWAAVFIHYIPRYSADFGAHSKSTLNQNLHYIKVYSNYYGKGQKGKDNIIKSEHLL